MIHISTDALKILAFVESKESEALSPEEFLIQLEELLESGDATINDIINIINDHQSKPL
jgi:hypothetical protein